MRLVVTPWRSLPLKAMTIREYRCWLAWNPTVAHSVRPIRLVTT